ncbi:MAG: hypothetical protein QW041_01975 [Candidatus Pacearchaeota archaeon]
MSLIKKISEEEDLLHEAFLDYKARKKLYKLGYEIKMIGNKLIITNKDTTIHFGSSAKGVFYFSVSNRKKPINPKIFFDVNKEKCELKVYPTKLEIIAGNKEWHIGFNSKDKIFYSSFSKEYKDVRNCMLECAKYYKK